MYIKRNHLYFLLGLFIQFFVASSCNENNSQKTTNNYKLDSSQQTKTDTIRKNELVKSKDERDTIITYLDSLLNVNFDGKLHIINDKKANWNREDFDYIIRPRRKQEPYYPYLAKGDFNMDGKQDYVSIVTNDSTTVFKLAIFLHPRNIIIWQEDIKGAGIEKYNTPQFNDIKGNIVRLKGDGILVQWYEASSYVVYWSGVKFLRAWTGD